jgi:hypothetical protein
MLATLQELQNQALKLPSSERWQLAQVLLESLGRESDPKTKLGNLSRLRGIAKSSTTQTEVDTGDDYVNYLTKKYD